MPELPEVETFRRYIERTSLHRRVERVEVRRTTVLASIKPRDLSDAVEGSSFEEARRRGKQLILSLSNGSWMTWHFGMTGEPVFFEEGEEEPRFARVLFHFKDGTLAFDDPRMLGRIGLTPSMDDFVRKKKLGPDALSVSKREFLEIFTKAKGAVKPALMDQHKISGMGNIYTDEVLFQSRIDPRADLRTLDRSELELLYRNTRRVLKMSIDRGTDFSKFPRTYILHDRRKGALCPLCGGRVETVTLGGRTTYYCPSCQASKGGEG